MNSCKDSECVIQKAGGKDWECDFYKSVIETALKRRLPIIAANISSKDAMTIARDGFGAAISPETLRDFNLDTPLNSDLFHQSGLNLPIWASKPAANASPDSCTTTTCTRPC
jgi:hypothetical protein